MTSPLCAVVSVGLSEWGQHFSHDSLPIGGIAVALMLGTGALLQGAVSGPLLFAGFCGTALIYLLDRTVGANPEDAQNHPERTAWGRRHRRWLMGEGVVLGGCGLATLPFLRSTTLISVGLLLMPVGLHLLPDTTWVRSLRGMGLVKPLVVAGVWAVGGTLLPLVEAGAGVGPGALALAGYRFLFILPNVLVADWGDRAGDAEVGLQPWTEWGTARGLRWAATGLLGLAVAGAVGAAWHTGRPLVWGVDAVGPVLMGIAVWRVRPSDPTHRLLLDLLVAWPGMTGLVAWTVAG